MSLQLITLLLISPLIGFLINGLFGKWLKNASGWIACLAVLISLICSLVVFSYVQEGTAEPFDQSLYTWIAGESFSFDIGFRVDALTTVMLLVITGVGFLIHVYSIGYMHGDSGYTRYFAYLNLFVFAMLILVLANNYLMMFIGWEGVGLCSYLLIGYWYEKKSATDAGKKAFIVNRIGDFGFLLGIFTLFAAFGTLHFEAVFEHAESGDFTQVFGASTIVVATLLLFVGAVGKSAQIPLYVWLPDAMEGPTPVSSLIHAATMVTAGVYMVARSHVLYDLVWVGDLVAWIGILTAFFAASIAVVNNNLKRILAYSTVSQLGYMFVGVGVGAYAASIFHLMTHAFFKGLLFLTAGSVMHAMSTTEDVDMRYAGGLWGKIRTTAWTFLIGAIAISGVLPLSGFWSKDEILAGAFHKGRYAIWMLGLMTAGLTAFYMFRLIFMTFFGGSRIQDAEVESHVHESPKVMTVPLIILAFFSVVAGWIGIGHGSPFLRFLGEMFHAEEEAGLAWGLIGLSWLSALAGFGIAYWLYIKSAVTQERVERPITNALHRCLSNKYYIDEIYNAVFVQPIRGISHYLFWKIMDVGIIDGIVNLTAFLIRGIGGSIRRIQTGVVPTYVVSMVIGIVIFLGYYLFVR